ncbi:Gfo/Idh/MocA family protein [Planctomicrobium piriforme]|uniref:Predicted dehydrogenase n=1 Tax=Planctomicrobium piriforme TaxID=1576369 RepID=A0A1I3CAV2_9PLAN|nr:Gfo/Idh/MocA family oxidoreductase [Planctomicrobium piriforme]SFH71662.1 Predicted dehydrogenase [Planctomicrobium piriforme]
MNPSIPPLRVALLGCGQIADAHLAQLRRIRNVDIVSVCDVHEDLAWQAAKRFQVARWDTSLDRMLDETRPDVVHLTTPAQTHAPLAQQLLEAGCHVYVEKPFTLNAAEAAQVFETAARCERLVCVGHDQLFDAAWLKAKAWIRQGLLGEVRHIESILGYPIDGKFGSLVASNPRHWVRQLPGGLFQNTISHPLYRITDLLADRQSELLGGWRTRQGFEFPTELSISLQGLRQSGSLTFSTFLPPQRVTKIYGTKGTVSIDFDAQTLQFHRLTKLPGAFAKLEAPFQHFRNASWNLANNLGRFARADIHYFGGMKTLFERFYDAIRGTGPHPIPHVETYEFTLLMDRIFDHCRAPHLVAETESREVDKFQLSV